MLHLPLKTVKHIKTKFLGKLNGYSIDVYKINELESVLLIEDSLILYVGISESSFGVCLNYQEVYKWTLQNKFMEMPNPKGKYYLLHIEEFTYNEIQFKYNHSEFLREIKNHTKIEHLSLDVTYKKFKGFTRLYYALEEELLIERINNKIPELKIMKRYEEWDGILYYILILRVEDFGGRHYYAVAYSKQKPSTYILNKCINWIYKGIPNNLGDIRYDQDFLEGLKKLKGGKRQEILENNFNYFAFKLRIKEEKQAWRLADKELAKAKAGNYNNVIWDDFTRPVRKWKNEELLYNIVRKLFKKKSLESEVIFQHRPRYLKIAVNRQLSYDIYVTKYKIAFEYQGEQHFKPIDFFGGEKTHAELLKRDRIKKNISIAKGVKLIYVNYWENITEELIKNKINETKILAIE